MGRGRRGKGEGKGGEEYELKLVMGEAIWFVLFRGVLP